MGGLIDKIIRGRRKPKPPPAPVPSPGASAVIRVTTADAGELVPRFYSYWPNAWVNDLTKMVYVFAGHADGQPRGYTVDLETHDVGTFDVRVRYTGTTEGWYWDADGWIYIIDGPRLRRVNPFTGVDRVAFDISDTNPGCDLWQAHSSDDGRTHSATVRRVVSDGAYRKIGTVVARDDRREFFSAQGDLDESQITTDGAFLIIQEDNHNRIVDLASGNSMLLQQNEGAVGHADCGPGYIVGEDDHHGACVRWDLAVPLPHQNRRELCKTWNMGHVSVRGGRCLLSDSTHLSLVGLDGSGVTKIAEHGMVSDGSYDTQVKANLDPTGRVACYMSNQYGRMDVFILTIQ
jgi:hypothetical protein